MPAILIDSGPLIALFDASDSYHKLSVEFIRNNKSQLISTNASITETLHMLDFSKNAQLDFISWIAAGAITIQPIANNDFKRIFELSKKYQDLPVDFADACLVYLAEKLHIDKIATIDKDFAVYRINNRQAFKPVLRLP